VLPDLDYARLQRSLDYFIEHYPLSAPNTFAHPAPGAAIADFLESTQDFCGERVAEIDRDLQKRDAYTISFLRDYFAEDQRGKVRHCGSSM
jgi:hypothetical protein